MIIIKRTLIAIVIALLWAGMLVLTHWFIVDANMPRAAGLLFFIWISISIIDFLITNHWYHKGGTQ